jgi:hypothetical protein
MMPGHTGVGPVVGWMDLEDCSPVPLVMAKRRLRFDPLADRGAEHWLVVYDMTRQVHAATQLPAGTDLHAQMRRALECWTHDGWIIEGQSDYGFFFCHRDGLRREIRIQPTKPSEK